MVSGIMPPSASRKPKPQRARKKAQALSRPKKPVAAKKRDTATETALASLAHDIRTPLTGILALAELLAASDLGERERHWANGVKSAAEHLAQLTTIVCDAVRADAAGLALRNDPFSPRRLAETIGASLSARAGTNGLTSDITIARDLPDQVAGDPVRLRAMVENLVDNAVKFTARGGFAFRGLGEASCAWKNTTHLRRHRQRHRHFAGRTQTPVPPVLAGERHRVPPLWRNRPRPRGG